MLPNFVRIRPADSPDLVRAQDNIAAALQSVVDVPFLDGVWIKDVALTTAGANVAHGLGRPWTGYFITRMTANATVWVLNTDSPLSFLALDASGTVTVDLWVF